ncbi:hypothetical protein [Enterococcus sp. AZ163]|uniref:hypothetical protein n=1 Tax=Enterococcus sp. AZ163 TaxID=2774638 RepID=UPI003D27B4B7
MDNYQSMAEFWKRDAGGITVQYTLGFQAMDMPDKVICMAQLQRFCDRELLNNRSKKDAKMLDALEQANDLAVKLQEDYYPPEQIFSEAKRLYDLTIPFVEVPNE